MSQYVTSKEAREILGIGRSAFDVLKHKRTWHVEKSPGDTNRYLRAEIEAERDARDARPPIRGARLPEPVSPAQASEARERDCLRCREPFWSEHKGNRLCGRCNAFARSLRSSLGV